jgi:acylphosphatase
MAKRLLISGRVQGVGFRYSMAGEAERLGVTGWVRNRRDGTVEAVVDGEPHALEAILAWARRGPRGARVTDVQVADIAGSFERFEMRPTE